MIEISDSSVEDIEVCEYVNSYSDKTPQTKIGVTMMVVMENTGVEVILTKEEILNILKEMNEYEEIEYTYSEIEEDEED